MTTTYDTVIYPNRCLAQTHPERLAVLANLHGLQPAAPEKCRYLEIGCGDGGNLLPQAVRHPNSYYVGFDLAHSRISAGLKAVSELGLANVSLSPMDIMDFPLEGDPFDYIVAHGIYSWVPAEVRERILAICSRRLAPKGVAYISYNCLPGCHIRQMVREVMRFHVRDVRNPEEQIRQAKAVCMLVANSIEKPDAYRQVFKEQLEQIQKYSSGHLFHDDLAEVNQPFYFHEFLSQSARHGLKFLSEADFFESQPAGLSPQAQETFSALLQNRVTFEQYLDFVKCRRFRQTLVCKWEAQVSEAPQASAIEHFHISARVTIRDAGKSSRGRPAKRFEEKGGGALEMDHDLGIHALEHLNRIWPATCSFDRLFQIAAKAAGLDAVAQGQTREELLGILLECYGSGLVDFRRSPVRCASMASTRPRAYAFARWQISHSETVFTMRDENLRIEDDIGKQLLHLMDGTRSWEEIEKELPDDCHKNETNGGSSSRLKSQLDEMAQLALLEE